MMLLIIQKKRDEFCFCLKAKTTHDAEEGLLFMQEMIELSKFQPQQTETKPQLISFVKPGIQPAERVTLLAGPAQFGTDLRGNNKVTGKVVIANPLSACTELNDVDKLKGRIVLVIRGTCMFIEKVSFSFTNIIIHAIMCFFSNWWFTYACFAFRHEDCKKLEHWRALFWIMFQNRVRKHRQCLQCQAMGRRMTM